MLLYFRCSQALAWLLNGYFVAGPILGGCHMKVKNAGSGANPPNSATLSVIWGALSLSFLTYKIG